MREFNNGEPYHGSCAVEDGGLRGATDITDYFYFFCPKCPDDYIVRILEYAPHTEESENPYNPETMTYAETGFSLVFKLQCEQCGHTDFVKISNTGWQGGKHSDALRK